MWSGNDPIREEEVPELCNQPPDKLACFSHFARVLLPFIAQKARGVTFLPVYSTEIRNLSEKRSKVVWPQREMQILIENGNKVAWPPCQTFHSWIFIQKGNTVAWPPSQILQVWHIIKKGRWFQKSLFQWEFSIEQWEIHVKSWIK